MHRSARSIIWLLVMLVGVAVIVPDSGEAIIAKAVQAVTDQSAGPDLDDLTHDIPLPVQTNPLPRPIHSQLHDSPAFIQVFPSAAPGPISLRL